MSNANDVRKKIDELVADARDMGYGDSIVDAYQQAVQLADEINDIELGFDLRKELMDACAFSGHNDVLLVAFAWCLGQSDRNPERFNDDLLWQYKWVIGNAHSFPSITLERIADMTADFEQRCKKIGAGARAVSHLRRDAAFHCGNAEAAKEWHKVWSKLQRDYMTDCRACETDDTVDYLAFLDEDEEAVKMAEPILQERLRCTHVPHRTFAGILYPLFKLKDVGRARQYHLRGIKMIGRNREFMVPAAEHIRFLTLTENFNDALRVYRKFVFGAGKNELQFYLAALVLFTSLKNQKKEKVRVQVPSTSPLFRESGTYATAELVEWFDQYASELARKFDARNGNRYASSRVELARDEWRSAVPFPMKETEE